MRWAAPELVLSQAGMKLTTKSDIYSFGCIGLQESPLDTAYSYSFMFLQVLSGEKPWSEAQTNANVVIRIAQGYQPGRPDTRAMDDLHWDFVQQCWSSISERPSADRIVTSVLQFLSSCPPSTPLRDLLVSSETQPSPPDGSYEHAVLGQDGQQPRPLNGEQRADATVGRATEQPATLSVGVIRDQQPARQPGWRTKKDNKDGWKGRGQQGNGDMTRRTQPQRGSHGARGKWGSVPHQQLGRSSNANPSLSSPPSGPLPPPPPRPPVMRDQNGQPPSAPPKRGSHEPTPPVVKPREPVASAIGSVNMTRNALLRQLEYYFRPQNMEQDFYLRQRVSPGLWDDPLCFPLMPLCLSS